MVDVRLNGHHDVFGISALHSCLPAHRNLAKVPLMCRWRIVRTSPDQLDRNCGVHARTIESRIVILKNDEWFERMRLTKRKVYRGLSNLLESNWLDTCDTLYSTWDLQYQHWADQRSAALILARWILISNVLGWCRRIHPGKHSIWKKNKSPLTHVFDGILLLVVTTYCKERWETGWQRIKSDNEKCQLTAVWSIHSSSTGTPDECSWIYFLPSRRYFDRLELNLGPQSLETPELLYRMSDRIPMLTHGSPSSTPSPCRTRSPRFPCLGCWPQCRVCACRMNV